MGGAEAEGIERYQKVSPWVPLALFLISSYTQFSAVGRSSHNACGLCWNLRAENKVVTKNVYQRKQYKWDLMARLDTTHNSEPDEEFLDDSMQAD